MIAICSERSAAFVHLQALRYSGRSAAFEHTCLHAWTCEMTPVLTGTFDIQTQGDTHAYFDIEAGVSRCLSPSRSLSLSVSLCLCVSLSVSLSLCLPLPLSLTSPTCLSISNNDRQFLSTTVASRKNPLAIARAVATVTTLLSHPPRVLLFTSFIGLTFFQVPEGWQGCCGLRDLGTPPGTCTRSTCRSSWCQAINMLDAANTPY
jgi:hypothetical protein